MHPIPYTILMLASGILWTSVYVLMIRRGFLDKTYGMPLAALSANIAWEFVFSFMHPHDIPQVYVNRVWLAFDLVIVCQFFRYGWSEFRDLPKAAFAGMGLASIAAGFCLVLFITREFGDYYGAYTAFGQNLMMSILFIAMLRSRGGLRGQSLYIALLKWLGTAAPSLAYYLYEQKFHGSALMSFLYVSIFLTDLLYVILVWRACAREGIRPWKRA